MYPYINLEKTGKQIQKYMNQGGYCVQDIQTYLGLSCKQSVYKWLKGKSLPNLEHLCALSYLFHCKLDDLVVTQMNYYVIKETICQIGGSLGSYLGMYCFHHKTKHMKFYIGIPLILFIQILIYCFYFYTKF